MSDKTHYKRASNCNSPYSSSADIPEPTGLTISHVKLELDRTKKTKDRFNTAHFVEKEIRPGEPLKPMILNATNCKVLAQLTGSKFIEDWVNLPVTVYVETGVKFGRDVVEGLRIMPRKPAQKQTITPADTKAWANAAAAYKRDGNLDAVLVRVDISAEHQAILRSEHDKALQS